MDVIWIQILVLLAVTVLTFSQEYRYDRQSLTEMPSNVPADAIFLSLAFNDIESFQVDDFEKFYQLETIGFGYNPVKVFPNFLPVRKTLLTVSALHADLTVINETIFNELRILENLVMCCNKLTSLPNVPGPGNTLWKIIAKRNLMTKFPPLYHYKALMMLDLSENPMTSVQDSDVDNLEQLKILTMKKVPLRSLPYNPKALQGLKNIDISSSNVSAIGRFQNLWSRGNNCYR